MEEVPKRLTDEERRRHELTVMSGELTSLKPNRAVYSKQPNSNIFFLVDRKTTTDRINSLLHESSKEKT
ncbi:hypothetical protein TrispH2_009511 [Trichoplax sp. H2]|nr:hypothetical protein TrispH2_009511 [Trichoplax sp. H2]|eukprot:RDD38623.1 hypothetical protein TrispH2_009511 [Trichoplax sp. H2]